MIFAFAAMVLLCLRFISIAFKIFIILLMSLSMISFGYVFVEISGNGRLDYWDSLWFPPEKMEVISYRFIDDEIHLWLKKLDGKPLYYIVHDKDGKKKKELSDANEKAKKRRQKLMFRFYKNKLKKSGNYNGFVLKNENGKEFFTQSNPKKLDQKNIIPQEPLRVN